MLADQLAKITGKNLALSAGILRLACKDMFGQERQINTLSFSEMQELIRKGLRDRLFLLRMHNTDEIIANLLSYINEYRSIFTFAAF